MSGAACPMADAVVQHGLHPGRQCRSVSFDDGKRRVIATDLDPEVDPLKLKPILGRPPTPLPSLTDCGTRAGADAHDETGGESSSRPPSAASRDGDDELQASLSGPGNNQRAAEKPPTKREELNAELLIKRLTLECAEKERLDEPAVGRERGEGPSEDACSADEKQRPGDDDIASEGGDPPSTD